MEWNCRQDITSETGAAYPSGVPEFTSDF